MNLTRFARIFLLSVLILALAAFPALAGPKAAKFTGDPNKVAFGANPLSQVPQYLWYHGCSPTSGGMLMGYWALHGYPQLLPNVTNPMTPGSQNPPSNVYKDISSAQHNLKDTYVGHSPNCIADFMQTVSGGTYINNIPTGLLGWSTYCGVKTATSSQSYVSYFGGSFSFAQFQTQISAGHPMLLNLMTYAPGYGWVGHTVLAYGFQQNLFNLEVFNGKQYLNITVPGFAVMDTWGNASGSASTQADWLGWNGKSIVYPLSQGGYVWWPFLDMTQTRGYSYANLWDWQVVNGVFYSPNGGTSSGNSSSSTGAVVRCNDLPALQNTINIRFSDNTGAGTFFSSGLVNGLSNRSRISGWSSGRDSGIEAVTHLLTF
jgi:hypothetical protein